MANIAISAGASGANEILAAAAGYKYQVFTYVLTANAAVNVKWQSAATDLTGLLYFAAKGKVVAPTPSGGDAKKPWFETASGEALNLNLSGTVATGGHLIYEKVKI